MIWFVVTCNIMVNGKMNKSNAKAQFEDLDAIEIDPTYKPESEDDEAESNEAENGDSENDEGTFDMEDEDESSSEVDEVSRGTEEDDKTSVDDVDETDCTAEIPAKAEEDDTDSVIDMENALMTSTSSSDEEKEQEEKKVDPTELRRENMRSKIKQRYAPFKGKRAYVRFAERLPADDDQLLANLKKLSPLIKSVTRPRQRSARFCIVTFDSNILHGDPAHGLFVVYLLKKLIKLQM